MKVLFSRHPLSALLLLLLFVLTACPGPNTSPPLTGTLEVTVAGLPSGVEASVSITGPDGNSQTITGTSTLPNLTPGSYTIAASNVNAGNDTYVPNHTNQTAQVTANATATATVSYERRPNDEGRLSLTITGLPEGVAANIAVTGPGGYNQTVTESRTLGSLIPGMYTISAGNVTSGDHSYVPDPLSREITVVPNTTVTAAVAYLLAPRDRGNLAVSITGLPTGANANVTVSGPRGFSQNVTESKTLINLEPGNFTITAANVSTGANVYIPAAPTQSATVTANATAIVTLSYSVQPGTLQLNISGLPSGASANVSITGPGGFSQNVSSTTALQNLQPGSYTISAGNVTSADISYIPSPSQQTQSVVSNATATAAVSYERQAAGTGSLNVTITGLPQAVNANVTVTGPEGYSRNVTVSTMLTNLAPGDYGITASSVSSNVNSYLPAPTTVTASVTAGGTAAATITYALEPGELAVTITGLPDDLGANVTLTGPGGYSQSVTASTTLSGLTPGEYLVKAENVSAGSDGYAPNPPSRTVTVTSGATVTATVNYVPLRPDRGGLALTISGLPEGVEANVTITGPDDFSENVTSSTTLSNLSPSGYTITAAEVTANGTTHNATPPTQVIPVVANQTASAEVVYAAITPDCLAPVNIPDAALRAVILEVLGKSSGDISCAEMLSLDSIAAQSRSIVNLEGLQYARNLTELELFGNAIGDISPLADLANLTSLGLTANRISDISPLAGLTSLTTLGLVRNQIRDISPLAGLTSLTNLGLEANFISNISPLAGLTNLSVLRLYANQISSIAPLVNLTKLKSLNLSANQIDDVSPLANLVNLTELHLGSNQISDISPLAGLTDLATLILYGNRVGHISPLAGLTSLTHLGLDDNQVRDLASLASLTALAVLDLGNNEVDDISALVQNQGLGEGDVINLRRNCLDLAAGSQDKGDIDALVQRRAQVHDTPQRNLSQAPCGGPRRGPPSVPDGHLLTVERTGDGTVTSDPAGINCGEDCAEVYAVGTTVTLTANAAENFRFNGWEVVGEICGNGEPSCVVTMEAPVTIVARFVAGPRRGPPSP